MAINLDAGKELSPARGRDFCRGCSGKNLFSALDLGELPLANELQKTPNEHVEIFPLHLRICEECGLGQVADVVTPERIFVDYRYLSSMSSTFLRHSKELVDNLVQNGEVNPSEWVLEIASNDGYLLKNFLSNGIPVLGIEPAKNVSEIARALGIETISEFFGSGLATELHTKRGFPKIIIANNVMAHVPDLKDFLQGLAIMCGPSTQIIVENPTLLGILDKMQFDTIYHEHYSYLSTTSVNFLCQTVGLSLNKVEKLEVHGGSNRYWIGSINSQAKKNSSVESSLMTERDRKLFDQETWVNYSQSVNKTLDALQEWLDDCSKKAKRVYGYGAAAKASTLINAIKLKPNQIMAIADISDEKQSRFMPPFGIRIISPNNLVKYSPTDILVFPWNIEEEISLELRKILADDVKLWSAIPVLHELTFR